MAREQVTTVPRRQARGGHVACAPAAGQVNDPSPEVQTPSHDNHRGQGMGHLQFYTHVTGVRHPTAHNAARPHLQRCARAERSVDPRKLLALSPQSQPRGLGRRLRLLVPSCEGGANIRSSSCPAGPCAATAVATVGTRVDNRLFLLFLHIQIFVLPKALKPYKKLQKCQKLLANWGSEDTV